MSLLLIFVKHLLHLIVKLPVYLQKLCCDILMHRAFAYSEFFCCASHGGFVFDYVVSEYDTSFFRRILNGYLFCLQSVCTPN